MCLWLPQWSYIVVRLAKVTPCPYEYFSLRTTDTTMYYHDHPRHHDCLNHRLSSLILSVPALLHPECREHFRQSLSSWWHQSWISVCLHHFQYWSVSPFWKEEASVGVAGNAVISVKHILIESADLLEIRKKYFEEKSLYLLFRNVIPEICCCCCCCWEISVFYKIWSVLR